MSKPAVKIPDVEHIVVDYLKAIRNRHLAPNRLPANATIGVGVPAGWLPTSPMHFQIVSDGTPEMVWPIVAFPTVRVVVRAATTALAKANAALAQGLLSEGGWPAGISIQPRLGVLAAQDPASKAELASVTMRVAVRSQPIP